VEPALHHPGAKIIRLCRDHEMLFPQIAPERKTKRFSEIAAVTLGAQPSARREPRCRPAVA
jgi:hypothetical protein